MPTITTAAVTVPTVWYRTTAETIVSTSTASAVTWGHWNESITSATTETVWTHWVLPAGTGGGRGAFRREYTTPFVESAEQLALRDTVRAEGRRLAQLMNAENQAAQAVKNAARDKARQLLLAQLDDRQRVDLASNGYFELETIQPSGERRRYRIHRGRSGNVERVDQEGRRLRRYCIHPVMACPDEDTMLTQKLWLEHNEELFLRTANAS